MARKRTSRSSADLGNGRKIIKVSVSDESGGLSQSEYIKTSIGATSQTIKNRAILELSNPSTVYILGGYPTYVHTETVYFDAGLKVANEEINRMLYDTVRAQKAYIESKISYINQAWEALLRPLGFGADGGSPFDDFKAFYDKIASNSEEEQNEYFRRLQLIQRLRTAADLFKEGTMDELKKQIARSGSAPTPQDVSRIISECFLPLGMPELQTVEIKVRGSGLQIANKAEIEKQLKSHAKQLFKEGCEWALSSRQDVQEKVQDIAKEFVMILGKDFANQFKNNPLDAPIDKAVESALDTIKTKIGYLFESLMIGSFEYMERTDLYTTLTDASGQQIERKLIQVVSSLHNERVLIDGKPVDNTKVKADSQLYFEFNTGGLAFLVSDKTGQTVNVSPDGKLMAQEHFSGSVGATLNRQGQPFGDKVFSPSVFNPQQGEDLTKLMNYVLLNASYHAYNHSTAESIKEFKYALVCFLAWLQSAVSIIGAPDSDSEIPLAVRTQRTIYNTADILQKFITLSPKDILTHIGERGYWSFLSADINNNKLPARKTLNNFIPTEQMSSTSVSATKRRLLGSLKLRRLDKELEGKSTADFDYVKLFDIYQGLFAELNGGKKLPSINTWWSIELDNLAAVI